MAIKTRTQAFDRLYKKLEALRVTLPDDERDILDGILSKNQVEAHKITSRAVSKVAAKSARKAVAKSPEVEAHKITSRAASRASAKAKAKAIGKAVAK
jgi:hypothetical protein